MKTIIAILFAAIVILGAVLVPSAEAQAVTGEKEYKELNPVHVANVSYAYDIACWGEKLAWSSGWGNITAGTVSGGAGNIIDAHYWGYDLCMSDSAIAWSAATTDVTSRSDIYTTGLSGGTVQYQAFNTDYDEIGTRIDGDRILYESMLEFGTTLRVSNMGSSSSTVMPCYPEAWNYDISGNYVVGMGDYSNLLICDVNGNVQKDYGQGWYATEGLRMSGDYITYYDLMDFGNGAHVYVKDWRTNETWTIIYAMEGQPGGLDIEGNFVVFSAAKNPEVGVGGGCMFIYDIQAEKTYQVSQEYSMIYDYAVGDGWIAWITKDSNYYSTETWYNIYAAELPEPGQPPADEPELPPDVDLLHVILNPTGTSRGIAVGEGISFDHKGVVHAVTVDSVDSAGAALTVYSNPQSLVLAIGEAATVDTDGNGLGDLSVALDSVDLVEQKAVVTIRAVSEGSDNGVIGLPHPGVSSVVAITLLAGLAIAVSRRTKR